MKTRLDEIVYQEMQALIDHDDTHKCCRSIAERAFRHGVEQTLVFSENAYTVHPLPAGEVNPRVQPAPAKEKNPHIACCSWCLMPHTYHLYCKDRRRGKRRKADRRKEWLAGRRSGTDRRKP
jgi:hypothetical protein